MTTENKRRVALVTGGGSGIGESTCLRFAESGMAVGVLDIDGASAQKVATNIRVAGGEAVALQTDISNKEQIESAVTNLRETFGAITVLVNNAAIAPFAMFEDITEESWNQVMDVNLKSIWMLTRAVLTDMDAEGWGRIVNIGAYGAQFSTPGMAHYYASKGGLISLTRCMAAEFGPRGITVNTVSPGFIDTPMARAAIEGGKFPVSAESIYGAYPIPRLGKPEEIAAACAYFVSEDAGYVTAQMLGVNGGAVV